jgi:hypothetical protein
MSGFVLRGPCHHPRPSNQGENHQMNAKASLPLIAIILVLMVGHGIKDASAQISGGALPIAKIIYIAHPLSLSAERSAIALNAPTNNSDAASAPTLPNDGTNPNAPDLPENETNPNMLNVTAAAWGILGGILAVLVATFFLTQKKQ